MAVDRALTIRPEQMQTLGQAQTEVFVEEAAAIFRKTWPARSAALGDDGLRDRVRRAVRKCFTYGIEDSRDVLRYVNLMFALGEDFATSPRFPWAGRILEQRRVVPSERLCRLAEKATAVMQ
jgi:hypothetical protein